MASFNVMKLLMVPHHRLQLFLLHSLWFAHMVELFVFKTHMRPKCKTSSQQLIAQHLKVNQKWQCNGEKSQTVRVAGQWQHAFIWKHKPSSIQDYKATYKSTGTASIKSIMWLGIQRGSCHTGSTSTAGGKKRRSHARPNNTAMHFDHGHQPQPHSDDNTAPHRQIHGCAVPFKAANN